MKEKVIFTSLFIHHKVIKCCTKRYNDSNIYFLFLIPIFSTKNDNMTF